MGKHLLACSIISNALKSPLQVERRWKLATKISYTLELSLTQDFKRFLPGLVMFIQIRCGIGTFNSQSGIRGPAGYVKYLFQQQDILYSFACHMLRPITCARGVG